MFILIIYTDVTVSHAAPVYTHNLFKVVSTSLQILPTDVIKASGKSTFEDVVVFFYTKLKAKLETEYGWTITITA